MKSSATALVSLIVSFACGRNPDVIDLGDPKYANDPAIQRRGKIVMTEARNTINGDVVYNFDHQSYKKTEVSSKLWLIKRWREGRVEVFINNDSIHAGKDEEFVATAFVAKNPPFHIDSLDKYTLDTVGPGTDHFAIHAKLKPAYQHKSGCFSGYVFNDPSTRFTCYYVFVPDTLRK
jgi:hypothetical protein